MNNTLLLGLLALLLGAQATQIDENDIPELEYLDTSIDPCADFYQFTCGNFKTLHPLPSTANIVDHFSLLDDDLIQVGHEILSSPKQDEDPVAVKKAKTAYNACASVILPTKLTVPELQTVSEFGGMPLIAPSNDSTRFSWNEIGDMAGRYGVQLVFVFSVIQLNRNTSQILIDPDTLLNPNFIRPSFGSSYDEVLEEDFRQMGRGRVARAAEPAPFDIFLRTLASNLLKFTNPTKPDDQVLSDLDNMANFMRSLYAGGIIDDDIMPLDDFPPTLAQLQAWTDLQFGGALDMNWVEYFQNVFQMAGVKVTDDLQVYHQGIERIYGILNLVRQTDPDVVKNFALLRVFLFQAPDSDRATRKAFEDYYTAKNYPLYPRWEYCTRKILDVVDTASLSFAVAYDYQRYHYNINKIPQAVEMINNIQEAFGDSLETSDWLDAESRDAAVKKAQNMLVLLAYPDFVANKTALDEFYENFPICELDNYGNARTIRAFKQAYQFSQVNQPDRAFWSKSPFDPNAYYNRPNNKIVIPIAMLNPVFFTGDNAVLDYSRLGSIVGHEITHGFDENGKNYNEDGLQEPWWSDFTMTAFADKSSCFMDQYSKYYVSEINAYVNGSLCINENLADNGGVREAFKAFKKLADQGLVNATGLYTLEQLFFIGYGTMWCSAESAYYLQVITGTSNGYAPNRYRVIGSLSNMKEFSDAFTCPIGSTMNPTNKCLLW